MSTVVVYVHGLWHSGGEGLLLRRRLAQDVAADARAFSYPSVGANATPIAFAEVYLALQNKTVDAQENPLPTILAKKFYEVQTHVNLTGHITEMLITIVGGHIWSKLSEADRKTFEAVFKEAAEKSNAEIVKSEQQLVGDFATKYGKTVVKSDRDAFKKVFAPFHVSKEVPWDKALYDRVQAIK